MTPFSYSTAALLFPAISLLMQAYTIRFLGLASVARHLAVRYREQPDERLREQGQNLRARISLLRHTQAQGVLSLMCCTASLLSLFLEHETLAWLSFGAALLFMLLSLAFSLREVHLSERALHIELDDLLQKSQRALPVEMRSR